MHAATNEDAARYGWLRGRPELTALIVRFNTATSVSIHPDRVVSLLDYDVIHKVPKTARCQRRLSEALQRAFKLETNGFYDFQPLCRRFALLDYSSLEQLAVFSGAAMLSRQLSRIVAREELQAAKASLGDDLFDYAVKEASLTMADVSCQNSLQTITADAVKQIGWAQLEHSLAGEPPELTRRLELKLPPDRQLGIQVAEGTSDKERAATFLRKVLITKVEPELKSCFQ